MESYQSNRSETFVCYIFGASDKGFASILPGRNVQMLVKL